MSATCTPTAAEQAALVATKRLRRLREQIVGMMIGCPLEGVTAAAEYKLVSADLDDDELATAARIAIEVVAKARDHVGRGIRSADLTAYIIGATTCRLGHRVHDGEQYGEPVPWLIQLAADSRTAVDPNLPATWTRQRFGTVLAEARTLAARVAAAEAAYAESRAAALRAERVLVHGMEAA